MSQYYDKEQVDKKLSQNLVRVEEVGEEVKEDVTEKVLSDVQVFTSQTTNKVNAFEGKVSQLDSKTTELNSNVNILDTKVDNLSDSVTLSVSPISIKLTDTSDYLATLDDGAYRVESAGTYTNMGGLVVKEGYYTIISKVGTTYKISSEVKMPMQDLSGLVVDNLDTKDSDKVLSANMGAVIKPRILPPNQEFIGIDRPDLDAALVEVDSDNKIIRIISEPDEPDISTAIDFDRPDLSVVFTDSDGKVIHKEYSGEVGDDLNKLMAVTIPVDRPDLEGSLIVLDQYDKVIFQSVEFNSTAPDPEPKLGEAMEYTKRFWNPPVQEGFNVQEPTVPSLDNILINYSNLIEKWDEIMNRQVINPDVAPYITKTELGRTGAGNNPIYRYDFKPVSPKYKVVLNAGTHANEKIYIQVLLNFFNHFTTEWVNDPVLEWMRRTIHFIVIPARGAYTIGFPERIRGSRPMPETDPIPMSWTRSGTTVTMTFDAENFPENDNLNAETYFTEVPASSLVGGTTLGVISSSDISATPLNAYIISGVIDGRTVTFEVPVATGATSGTGTFQVWADPNRNFSPEGTNVWHTTRANASATYRDQAYDNGQVYGWYDAKGTKPMSLRENAVFIDMINSEMPDLVYDLHSPANDHYFRYGDAMPDTDEFSEAIKNMKEFSGQYVTTNFNNLMNSAYPTGSSAYLTEMGIPCAAIEWGGGVQMATGKGVRDAMRWLIVAVTEVLKTIK